MSDRRASAPQSRRERPAKPALTRKGIIAAAMRILDEEGLDKVTTRRIAATLDTGPASLYVYVRNTEELYAHILDALIGRMPRVPAGGNWRERLRLTLSNYTKVLLKHPEVARMTIAAHPDGPNYFALVESVLELLHEGGVADATAAWAVDVLLASVTATAIEHGAGAPNADPEALSLAAASIAAASAKKYPRTVKLRDELLSGAPTERFEWGLDVLINGILATPRD
ncbi:MAG TPA: TetR/AcrR family transcriptional regulator C-terminal domain-containing protein [Galbitalea sp.]|jgi:AcrR family transcriptional regulator|nr:TetR/AcrR family transcriptional regulator C-terminal domain-containing protein [Galbitalea sp.]